MDTFDQALKYLAQQNPRDFIRFALGDPNIEIEKPLPTGLPARRRDIDGCYLISPGDSADNKPRIAHLEFHRRNQSLEELGIDVTEAQLRLFRREGWRVTSLVWDLYGKRDEPFLEPRKLLFGEEIRSESSQGVYLRVNLRAIGWQDLLQRAPPVLWPLVALTRDGAHIDAIVATRDAIVARKNLGNSEQTDYLAVLRFVAEAENVPKHVLDVELLEDLLMGSEFYQSVVKKGFVKGETHGAKKELALAIVRALRRRLGSVNDGVQERIMAETNLDTLREWHDQVMDAVDAESARGIVEGIQQTKAA